MQISLRSQMVAGVAALGATAIAITPIAQPDLLPSMQRVSANVNLAAAIINPINAIGGVIQDINTDLLNQGFVPGLTWPDYFFGTDDFFYGPNYLGLLPDATNLFSSGPLSALINNISGYAWAGIRGAGVIGSGTAAALFNTPFALVAAVQELVAGDPDAALETLKTEILGPLLLGINGAVEAVGYIADNIISNVQTVLFSTVPFVLGELIGVTTDGLGTIANTLVNTVTTAFGALTSLDPASVWNALVGGLLSRDGVLGQIEQLTIGIGILDGDEVVVPSYRSVITSELQRLGDFKINGDGGILNDPFNPPPAPPPGAAVRAAAAKPAVTAASAVVDTPAVEAPAEPTVSDVRATSEETTSTVTTETTTATEATGTTAGGDTSASAEKPSKHRVSRKAAADN